MNKIEKITWNLMLMDDIVCKTQPPWNIYQIEGITHDIPDIKHYMYKRIKKHLNEKKF